MNISKYLTFPVLIVSFMVISCSTAPSSPASFAATTNYKKSSTSYNSFFPATPVKTNAPSSLGSKTDRHGYPVYALNDSKRYVRTTAYSCAEKEKGGIYKNFNAAGTTLKYGKVRSAAADWSIYPLGTTFKIKGLPHTYVVDDYGSALVGAGSIDIYHPSKSLMNKWNTRPAEIQIIKMGDWDRSAYLLKGRLKYKHCRKMYYGVVANQKKFKKLRLASNN